MNVLDDEDHMGHLDLEHFEDVGEPSAGNVEVVEGWVGCA